MDTNDYRMWLDSIDVDIEERIGDIHTLYHQVKDSSEPAQVVTLRGFEDDKLTITSATRQGFLDYLDSLYSTDVDSDYQFRKSLGLVH